MNGYRRCDERGSCPSPLRVGVRLPEVSLDGAAFVTRFYSSSTRTSIGRLTATTTTTTTEQQQERAGCAELDSTRSGPSPDSALPCPARPCPLFHDPLLSLSHSLTRCLCSPFAYCTVHCYGAHPPSQSGTERSS